MTRRRSVDRYFFIDSLSIEDLITESQPDAVERDAHYAPRNYYMEINMHRHEFTSPEEERQRDYVCVCYVYVYVKCATLFSTTSSSRCRVMRPIEIFSPVDIHTGCPWPTADFLLTTDCCVSAREKNASSRYLVSPLFKRKTIEVGHWRY